MISTFDSFVKNSNNRFRMNLFQSSEKISELREKIPGNEWIDKLRFVFGEADIHKNGLISLRNWLNSRIRYLISDSYLTDEEMEDFFIKIDTDLDGFIKFEELENYLISHQGSVTMMDINKVCYLTYVMPNDVSQSMYRSERCLKAIFVKSIFKILSISETTFTIWEPSTCKAIHQFSDRDKFVDFCYMPTVAKVAIAKQNRKVIFFDLKSLKKMNLLISASLDSQQICRMTLNESYGALRHVAKGRVPLFNQTTCITADPKHSIFYVGDDIGKIEVFEIHQTGRHSKAGYAFNRFSSEQFHSATVSQIIYLEHFHSFISSSYDGSLQMWQYDPKYKMFATIYTFNDPLKFSILSMIYDENTHTVIYNTSNHYICSWTVKTKHRTYVATPDTVNTLAVYPSEEKISYLVTVSANHFFTSYQLPSYEPHKTWFIGSYHEYCTPTASVLIGDDLYLIGSYLSLWKVEISEEDVVNPHSGNIIAALMNDEMGQLITIDQKGNQVQWNIMNGIKQFKMSHIIHQKVYLNCANMDKQRRRLGIGFSTGDFQIISVNSNTVLVDVDNKYCVGGCNYIEFGVIFGLSRVICATGIKTVVVFDDIRGNRLRFLRNFIGHSENVMKIVILKEKLILTIGVEHEMFLWSLSTQYPIYKYELKGDPSTAIDLPNDPDIFVAGDVNGYIHFISLKTNSIISSMNVFHMVVKSGISCLSIIEELELLVISNIHGYVVFWSLKKDEEQDNPNSINQMKEERLFRAHTNSILSIIYSPRFQTLLTFGRDDEIRLWSMNKRFCLIGELGKSKKWKLDQRETYKGDENIEYNEKDFEDYASKQKFTEIIEGTPTIRSTETFAVIEPTAPEPVEFSIENFMNMINKAEDQIYQGDALIKRVSCKKDEGPRLTRPKPPVKRARFNGLIPERDLELTSKYLMKVRERSEKDIL